MRDVPIFSDDATFEGHKVDVDVMRKIVNRMQRFGPASVIIGHTDESNKYDEKEVVGLAVNFRIENGTDGKTYLVCDIILNDSEILNKYPRRSVELWDDYTIDPIALLGSSTPRIDLPTVIKYKRYGRGNHMTHEELKEVAQQVLDMLKETAEWKFLAELQREWAEFQEALKGAEPDNQAGGEEVLQEPVAEAVAEEKPEPEKKARDDDADVDEVANKEELSKEEGEEGEAQHDADDLEELDRLLSQFLAEEKEEKADEEKKDEEEVPEKEVEEGKDKEKYYAYSPTSVFIPQMVPVGMRGTRGNPSAYPTGRAGLYSRSKNKSDMEKNLKMLLEENRKLKEMYRREKRAAILQRLAAEGYNLDVEDELKYTSDMSDAKFVEHLRRIRQYYSRTPTAPVNPAWLGTNSVLNEEIRNKAIELAYNKGISFEEALKQLTNQ